MVSLDTLNGDPENPFCKINNDLVPWKPSRCWTVDIGVYEI